MTEKSLVITVSRQLGSGGAYIGQQLASKLKVLYVDREIISQAANQLSVLEEDLESRDERIPSFWQSFSQLGVFNSPDAYIPPQVFVPTGRELFKVEAQIIRRIADEHSVVIIGRCGSHVLRARSNHTSVFLHGDLDFRKGRVQELYNVSPEEAAKMIAQSDSERGRYHHTLTGKEWTDARQYDLSIDTGKIGVDSSIKLIMQYLELG